MCPLDRPRLVQVFFRLFPRCTPEIHLSDLACQLTLMYESTKKAAPLFLFVKKKKSPLYYESSITTAPKIRRCPSAPRELSQARLFLASEGIPAQQPGCLRSAREDAGTNKRTAPRLRCARLPVRPAYRRPEHPRAGRSYPLTAGRQRTAV